MAAYMTYPKIAVLLVLQVSLGGVQGAKEKWRWTSGLETMSDEEIVDLLYTDPNRLRAMAAYPPKDESSQNERPKMSSKYPKKAVSGGSRASSYTRVEYYSPSAAQKDSAVFSNLVLH